MPTYRRANRCIKRARYEIHAESRLRPCPTRTKPTKATRRSRHPAAFLKNCRQSLLSRECLEFPTAEVLSYGSRLRKSRNGDNPSPVVRGKHARFSSPE